MASLKPKSRGKSNKKKKFVISKYNPRQKYALIIFLLVFVVIGGYVAFKSSSAATYPNYRTGSMDWNKTLTPKYSSPIKATSSRGEVCVATTFDSYNNFFIDYNYYFHIQELNSLGKWVQVRSSSKFSANGNRDRQCFDEGINLGKTYRVKFSPAHEFPSIRGTYWIWGYWNS